MVDVPGKIGEIIRIFEDEEDSIANRERVLAIDELRGVKSEVQKMQDEIDNKDGEIDELNEKVAELQERVVELEEANR